MRALRQGMTGEDVRYLKYKLKTEFYQDIAINDKFDKETDTAVRDVQKLVGFTGKDVDGSFGPATQAKTGIDGFQVFIFDNVWFAGTPYDSKRKTDYPLRTLKTWAELEKADITLNLAFYNLTGKGTDQYGPIKGRTLTYLKAKGFDCGYGGTSERLTIDSGNICAGYKLAVKDGKSNVVSIVGKRCRNANGKLKDGRYFHIQSIDKVTEKQLVDYMLKNYAVDLMLIQDSGGSTGFFDMRYQVLIAGEKEGTDGRAIASVVCAKLALTDRPIIDTRVCPCCGQEIKGVM